MLSENITVGVVCSVHVEEQEEEVPEDQPKEGASPILGHVVHKLKAYMFNTEPPTEGNLMRFDYVKLIFFRSL